MNGVLMPPPAQAVECDSLRSELLDLLRWADSYRAAGGSQLDETTRSRLGQFLTPLPVAEKLGELFEPSLKEEVSILDAGAGIGILTIAAVQNLLGNGFRPRAISLVGYEIEPLARRVLGEVFDRLCALLSRHNIDATCSIRDENFIFESARVLSGDLFAKSQESFSHAILNPPFGKLASDSAERAALSAAGIETSNLYAAFVWLAARRLRKGGELSAITPRSFCNGTYFREYREALLSLLGIDKFVLIEERDLAFAGDKVLQETVLFHGRAGSAAPAFVSLETAYGADLGDSMTRKLPFSQFVLPADKERVFHLVGDRHQSDIKTQMESLPCSLDDLSLSISTGRVVDFRAKEFVRADPEPGAVPLIYPAHLSKGAVTWPAKSKKADAIMQLPGAESLLVPMGHYVLLRRFSSKEEKRRVVPTLFTPFGEFRAVGFENHLNYFHANGSPIDPLIARGLACYLNSSAVDQYFRQFSGHTQVNASDLRRFRYPTREQLAELGASASPTNTDEIDTVLARILNFMDGSTNALAASRRIVEALDVLRALKVPKEQQNERSALVLLCLAGLKPTTPWSNAAVSPLGVTQIMKLIHTGYAKEYAPNTRETIRRFTLHQFVQMGLVALNPDNPMRPVNSPKSVYALEPATAALLREVGTPRLEEAAAEYRTNASKLASLRSKEREMNLIPVTLPTGETVELTAGGQNPLIKAIVEQFCPRYSPGGVVLYLGDAGKKFIINRLPELSQLGVSIDSHGKMPDLVIHHKERGWLLLIEAVTSHGPMNIKRKNELEMLFKNPQLGLVFVTAFETRQQMLKYLHEISWETEVWFADAPTHLIHFNGERFLGPYQSNPTE